MSISLKKISCGAPIDKSLPPFSTLILLAANPLLSSFIAIPHAVPLAISSDSEGIVVPIPTLSLAISEYRMP